MFSCCKLQVFYLYVAYVSHTCCSICFTHMLQVYVSSASDVCCIQVSHVASVSCFRGMFGESWGHGSGARGRGAVSRVPADGARDAPGVLQKGRARPHYGSCVPPTRSPAPVSRPRGEREEGIRGKERRARGEARRMRAGYAFGAGRGGWGRTIAIR